jgi:hypothetical protein
VSTNSGIARRVKLQWGGSDDLRDRVEDAQRRAQRDGQQDAPQRQPGRGGDVPLLDDVLDRPDAQGQQHRAERHQLDDPGGAAATLAEAAFEQIESDMGVVAYADGEADERDVEQQARGHLGGPGQRLGQDVPEDDLGQDGQHRRDQQ